MPYYRGMPNTVHPLAFGREEFFQFPYHAATDYSESSSGSLPNNNYAAQTKGGPLGTGLTGAPTPNFHPSEHAVGYASSSPSGTSSTGDKNDAAHKVYADSAFSLNTFEHLEEVGSGETRPLAPCKDNDADAAYLASMHCKGLDGEKSLCGLTTCAEIIATAPDACSHDGSNDGVDEGANGMKDACPVTCNLCRYDAAVATPATGHVADMVALASSGHHWGWGTCEFITHCDYAAGDLPGSPCAAPLNGQASVSGFCFESAHGTLECGRMISKDNEHMNGHVLLDAAEAYRCPRLAPVVGGGRHLVKRLLIGGCMDPTDADYDAYAEVHVPLACKTSTAAANANVVAGCMFPGAENHVPAAAQPANCVYLTRGCTAPTALNYNSEAAIDDASCVQPTYGCTLENDAYAASVGAAAIGTDTPNWNGGSVGTPTRLVIGGGENAWPQSAVNNYVAGANTDDGSCVVVIEGCTTEGSLNYDAAANTNSNTWCIPIATGCMLPFTAEAAPTYSNTGANAHQGLAINFDAAATVHDNAACTIKFTGCASPTALNYDALVTLDDGSCYERVPGCLDRTAYNFNCTVPGIKTDATKAALGCEELAYGSNSYGGQVYAYGVTVHDEGRCVYSYPPPPSPPPPSPAGDAPLVNEVVAVVTVDTTCDQGDSASAAVCGALNAITSEAVFDCGFACGSVVVTGTASGLSDAVKALVTTAIDVGLSSPEAASDFLNVNVVSVTYSVVVVVAAPPSAPATADDTGLVAGAAVGAIVVVALIILVVVMMMKKKKKSRGNVAPQ